MQRTQNRALVKTISVPVALAFAFVLGLIGFGILWFWVNAYAFLFAVIGFVVYVGFTAYGQNEQLFTKHW